MLIRNNYMLEHSMPILHHLADKSNFAYPAYEPPNVPPYPYPYVPYPRPYMHYLNTGSPSFERDHYRAHGDGYHAGFIIPSSGYEIGGSSCMTRSSTKELFTPFKDPEREFRSSRKLLKTLSLDESRSPGFNLFFDLEEYSEEEVAETTAETMKQYISKTRADYGSGIARPKINEKDSFELKGQFLKELHDNTFSGSDHEDANEHIKKVIEIGDLFHIPIITQDQKIEKINNFQKEPDETLYQAWERFKELLMKYPQHYLKEMQEVILFYNGLEVPTRQILDSKGAIPSKNAADAKVAIQKWLNTLKNGTMEHLGQEVLKLLTVW
ncbi:hypothetical protein Tco_0347583 [Tanacetum coccineum]